MKTVLSVFLSAGLLGLAAQLEVNLPSLAVFIAVAFSAGLAGWVIEAYRRKPGCLIITRPLHPRIANHAASRAIPSRYRKAA